MARPVAHESRWRTFEVVFGIPLLAAIALQWAIPLSFPRVLPSLLRFATGAGLVLAGGALVAGGRRQLARHDQPTDPGLPTSEIVTDGVYSVSRNPLYLGGTCVLAGIALVLDLPWVLVFLVPALVACHYLLILPEERYLAARFGQRYRVYSGSVRRWIGFWPRSAPPAP